MMQDNTLPLAGIRVVDLTDGVGGVTGRYLADLGADVILVEPPDGVPSRRRLPRHEGIGLHFVTTHHNKRGVVADLSTAIGRDQLLALTDAADIVLEWFPAGRLAELGLGQRVMRAHKPGLVVVSITPFGRTRSLP